MKTKYKKFLFMLYFISVVQIVIHASCLTDHEDAFIINEINTHGNWVELYANPSNLQSPVSNWQVTVCTTDQCETILFNYDFGVDGYFYILDFDSFFGGNDWNGKSLDIRVQDSAGNEVNYFNLGLKKGKTDTSLSVPAEVTACGIYDVSCDHFLRTNSSESNFFRSPDGGCSVTEKTPWNVNTQDTSNTGSPPPVTTKDGVYNAVDQVATACNSQAHWNNSIQTKLVNDNIDLSILAKDVLTDLPLEADITKVSLLYYPTGDNSVCTGASTLSVDVCTNCGTTDVDGCLDLSVNLSINDRASKCIEVVVEGKDTTDTAGTSLSTSKATDNFAIRPETYNCDVIAASTLIAEHDYPTDFIATPLNLLSPTLGYTTSSIVLSENKYMRTGDLNTSLNGVTTPSTLDFTDGSTGIVGFSFNDVGDIGIDLNDSVWANVDSDDTLEVERIIHAECRRTFRPDHFKVDLTRPLLEDNATNFTYLSNLTIDSNMSAQVKNLKITITAQGEGNTTMLNYSDPAISFYANEISLSPQLDLPIKHSVATKRIDLIDQNSSDIVGFNFLNGIATHAYADVAFNYDRNYLVPLSPFIVEGANSYFFLSVKDSVYPTVKGDHNTSSDANATFYYGRIHANDIMTTTSPVLNPVLFEVYDNANTPFTMGMVETSLSWYVNSLHSGNEPGHIIEAVASSNTIIDNVLGGVSFTYTPVLTGREDLGISSITALDAVIHLKTQKWLWYVPSVGLSYDDSIGSDCRMHPCFNYALTSKGSALLIKSGDFNGTVVPDENRSDYIRKGVKLFR